MRWFGWRNGIEGEAVDETERRLADRERYRQEQLYRPQEVQVIALNHVERDAAREVFEVMQSCLKVEERKRLGIDVWTNGLNTGAVVDEIINAINRSRVRQAQENLVNLRENRTGYFT